MNTKTEKLHNYYLLEANKWLSASERQSDKAEAKINQHKIAHSVVMMHVVNTWNKGSNYNTQACEHVECTSILQISL